MGASTAPVARTIALANHQTGIVMVQNRSIVVIGASGGIGSAVVRQLRQTGFEVVAAGRNLGALQELAAETGAVAYQLDATDFAATTACMKWSAESVAPLYGAVNCAGSLLLKAAHRTSPDEFAGVIAASLTTAFSTVHAATQHIDREGGSIVLVSSAAARIGLANHEAIAAAKGGVNGLVLSAATSYAPRSIRVNAVAPGLTATPLTRSLTENEMVLKGSLQMHALRRAGTPEDISRAICFLMHPDQSWLTGQILGVDGGLADLKAR
jgi:3-oxoacyl-[acyl-carrier protein] reductase